MRVWAREKRSKFCMFDTLRSNPRHSTPAALFISVALWLFASLALAQSVHENRTDSVTVATPAGSLRGRVAVNGAVDIFRGIPYAAPPVGEMRWKAPRPPQHWSGVRDAIEPGSPCPQTGRNASVNEDCLYLNVWTPHRRPQQRLPVMVYLHGGGQRLGAGDDYNADWLVTRGTPIVYVSINFRLNIFAFFAHQALTAENPQTGSGNAAMLDQIEALRWIRDNIASFGGDPKNVTIFGESGGAQAVCLLMASPPAQGLFHRAISQSGPCQWQYYPSLTASEERGVRDAAELGCADPNPLPCLRALPVNAILAKQRGAQKDTAGAQPAWGGGVFPLPMREAMASGRFNRVPLMQGATGDEALTELARTYDGGGKPVTPAQYPSLLARYFGQSRVAAVQKQYPVSDHASPFYALVAALTDSGMVTNNRIGLCNTHLANQLVAPHVPVYAFVFADRTAPYPEGLFSAGKLPGAGHGKDVSYLFHHVELTAAQRKISDTMIAYWTNFAAKGDPNGKGLPSWPVYKTDEQMVMRFESDGVRADGDLYARAKCKFWTEQGFSSLAGPYPTPSATGPDYQ
jgi:para-nitrobenzyl esterase